MGAQTPHLRRNHCRPLRKAQRPPGQVSEIKEQEEFQNIKKIANGTKKTFDTTLGHFLRSIQQMFHKVIEQTEQSWSTVYLFRTFLRFEFGFLRNQTDNSFSPGSRFSFSAEATGLEGRN